MTARQLIDMTVGEYLPEAGIVAWCFEGRVVVGDVFVGRGGGASPPGQRCLPGACVCVSGGYGMLLAAVISLCCYPWVAGG